MQVSPTTGYPQSRSITSELCRHRNPLLELYLDPPAHSVGNRSSITFRILHPLSPNSGLSACMSCNHHCHGHSANSPPNPQYHSFVHSFVRARVGLLTLQQVPHRKDNARCPKRIQRVQLSKGAQLRTGWTSPSQPQNLPALAPDPQAGIICKL